MVNKMEKRHIKQQSGTKTQVPVIAVAFFRYDWHCLFSFVKIILRNLPTSSQFWIVRSEEFHYAIESGHGICRMCCLFYCPAFLLVWIWRCIHGCFFIKIIRITISLVVQKKCSLFTICLGWLIDIGWPRWNSGTHTKQNALLRLVIINTILFW